MTQEQIDAIKAAYQEVKLAENRVKEAKVQWGEMLSQCDHVLPDGTSAFKDCWLYDVCEICGEHV